MTNDSMMQADVGFGGVQKRRCWDAYLLFRLRNQSSTQVLWWLRERSRASRNCVYTQTFALGRLFIQKVERRDELSLTVDALWATFLSALEKAADERPSCFLKSACANIESYFLCLSVELVCQFLLANEKCSVVFPAKTSLSKQSISLDYYGEMNYFSNSNQHPRLAVV